MYLLTHITNENSYDLPNTDLLLIYDCNAQQYCRLINKRFWRNVRASGNLTNLGMNDKGVGRTTSEDTHSEYNNYYY